MRQAQAWSRGGVGALLVLAVLASAHLEAPSQASEPGAATPSPEPVAYPEPPLAAGALPITGLQGADAEGGLFPATQATVDAVPAEGPVAARSTLRFGSDDGSSVLLARMGLKPDYATVWAGSWSYLNWDALAARVHRIADMGVVPVVEWYYWGDDLSRACVTSGCWSAGHGVWKSQLLWDLEAWFLADAVHRGLDGRPGIVVLESEFNKRDLPGWPMFNDMLLAQMGKIRERAPEAQVALGFGNWYPEGWAVFERAAQAADLVGLQTMRAGTRDAEERYLGAPGALVEAAQRLHTLFGKPILLHDVALSSWPSPLYDQDQAAALRGVFARLGDLEQAGVVGLVYRSITDHPTASTAGFFGEAERHFGFRSASGDAKPALAVWEKGVREARGEATG